jgi:dTDP-4-amino-4,6-dideoxygalactose transaminase
LRHLDADNAKRQQLAAKYSSALAGGVFQLPLTRMDTEQVFHLYVLRTADRAGLIAHLAANRIQAGIHYPMPVHLQTAYKGRLRTATDMGVTERLAGEVLSLPMYPELSSESSLQVISSVNSFFSITSVAQ